MALQFRGILGQASQPLDLGIRDIRLHSAGGITTATVVSGPDGGLTSYRLSEGDLAQVQDTRAFTPAMGALSDGRLSMLDAGGQGVIVTGTDSAGARYGYAYGADTGFGAAVRLAGLGGGDPSIAGIGISVSGRLYLADATSSLIHCLRPDGQGGYARQFRHDGAPDNAEDVIALKTAMAGGREYLLALCQVSDGLVSYEIAANGTLAARGAMGADRGLGILDRPVAMDTVTIAGKTFVIVASAAPDGQGGALSVMELLADGALVPTDHVLDTRNTRFGNPQDLAVVRHGDQAFVLAGGGDDGIALLSLLPDGRLVHLESLAQAVGLELGNVAALAAARLGDELQVLVASQLAPGLTQLSHDLSGRNSAFVARDAGERINGGAGHDVIVGGAGGDVLDGGDGDDIITDGAGDDHLIGGEGADRFVMVADGTRDRITGFVPGTDILDLSGFPMLYDPAQLTILSWATGARILWRDERIDITSTDRRPLDPEAVRASIARGPDRPPMMVERETRGTPGADNLEGYWGSDRMTGGDGDDILRGLVGDDLLIGGAGGDTLIGDIGNDTLRGDAGRDLAEMGEGDDLFIDSPQGGYWGSDTIFGEAGNDTVRGGGGEDVIWGGAGDDRLAGGAGNDRIMGEAGNDTLLGQTQDDRAFGGDGDDLIHGNGGRDTLGGGMGNDSIIGGIHDDVLYGGAGDDRVVGGPGRDWADMGPGDDLFIDMAEGGAGGSDTVLGGPGNDTFQGGGGPDRFEGDEGDDLLLGRNGDDTLFGGAGADTLLGGSGADLVAGGAGRDRVFLHGGDDRWLDDGEGGPGGGDFVKGGDGADTLVAGGGDDTLFGGAGADVFVFTTGCDSDRIMDFRSGTDTLRLDDALWAGNLDAGQVVARFASLDNGAIVFDFGADEIRLEGVTGLAGLAGDLDIF